jgi:hypothetical protein
MHHLFIIMFTMPAQIALLTPRFMIKLDESTRQDGQ